MSHSSKAAKDLALTAATQRKPVAAATLPQQFSRNKNAAGRVLYGGGKSSSANYVATGTPEIRDPAFSPETLFLANDLKTLNRWIRYYDTFHPILPNSLDLHATFPISDFSFKGVKDASILDFYTYIKEDVLKLFDWTILASREYEVLGEVFTFFGWDSYGGYYNSSTILNPDLLDVYPFDMEGQRKFIISMDIPQNLDLLWRRKDMDSRYRVLWNRLDPVIRRCVETGYKIPLSPNNCFGIQRLAFAYDTRGTSQVLRCLKDLFYEDKLREAQMAVADGHITPMRLWKIGKTEAGYLPEAEELDEWREMLQRAQHQNLFQIVCHDAVDYQVKGIAEGLLPITPELDKIEERILTALYTSKAMTSGEGPCVSEDTEVLTVGGFKPFPQVTEMDLVASVNPDTHEIEYCYPKEVLCFDVVGPMRHFTGPGLDSLVTPNHRCFVKASGRKWHEIVIADEVLVGGTMLTVGPETVLEKDGFAFTESPVESIDVPEYKGKVYSLDLPPNRLYVSRRNGKVCVTGNTFSSSVIAMKVLEGRYQNKLYRIESIIKALYRKIAIQHEFYEATPAEVQHRVYRSKNDRKLIVPKVHWENYFSFAKDIERAKFYLELAKAHKLSFKRVMEVLGLDSAEEARLVEQEINSVYSDDVLQARVKKVLELTRSNGSGDAGDNEGGPKLGLPNNFAEPGGGGGGSPTPLEDVGAEIPEGTSQPPLANVETEMEQL